MFVITGATGNTGSVAAEALLAAGKKVRVVVRDAAKAKALAERGAEVFIADLSDEAAARPSLLPGWTIGHLVTHLARNADSVVRRLSAAADGELVTQYEGGPPARSRDIEAGAGRPAAELLRDLQAAVAVRMIAANG